MKYIGIGIESDYKLTVQYAQLPSKAGKQRSECECLCRLTVHEIESFDVVATLEDLDGDHPDAAQSYISNGKYLQTLAR